MHHAPLGLADMGLAGGEGRALGRTELVSAYARILDRIDLVEPEIHALLDEPDRRGRVLGELEALLERHPDPARRPPLFAVPFGVKDIFHVNGFETRAGSKLPPALFTGREASSVGAARETGAILIGKTVTTEFAYFAPGPTRNPWNTAHTPGGSSSGSAAAVSAGYCVFALGTQTIGSITRPAAYCGVVGYKPSYGAVPTDGVIPFSVSADHVGLLASDVASARLVWHVLRTRSRRHRPTPGRVLLLLDDACTAQADVDAREAVAGAAAALEAAGFAVRKAAIFDDIEDINERHNRLVAREFADVHATWVAAYRDRYDPRSLELIERGRSVPSAELSVTRADQLAVRGRLRRALDRSGALAILSPASAGAAPAGIESTGSPLLNLPWTYAGVPTVGLPCKLSSLGLPLGLQMAGSYGDDEGLLALAGEVEGILQTMGSAR